MKILSLNTWGTEGPYEERWHCFLEELGTIQPDIACLQEVFEPTLIKKIEKIFRFGSAAAYSGGLVTLSHIPIVEEEVLNYNIPSPFEPYNREALLVTLKVGGESLLVANTHLAWKPEDTETRLKQVEKLLAGVAVKKRPALLAGDFNDTPESEPVRNIKACGFSDLFHRIHPDQTGFTWDNRNPFMKEHSITLPDRRIDFLFASKSFCARYHVSQCHVVFSQPNPNGTYPSDHYGLLVEFE